MGQALSTPELRKNPGMVGKNYATYLKNNPQALAAAGYYTRKIGNKWYLRNPYLDGKLKGKNLWSWDEDNYLKTVPQNMDLIPKGGGWKPPKGGGGAEVPGQDDPSGTPSYDNPGAGVDQTQLTWTKPPRVNIPGQYGANLSKEMKLLSRYLDPMAYMKMVGSGFNPAIQAMTQEISRQQSQPAKSGMDDSLKAWYESLIQANNAGAGATSDAAAGIMAGHDASTQGLANVLGGSASPAASSAAAFGQIGRNELEQLTQAQNRFEGAQGSNLALEGVEQRVLARQQAESENTDKLDAMRMQLIELQASQGDARAKAYLDAYQMRLGQVNDVADMKTLQSMNKWDQAVKSQGLKAGNQELQGQAVDLDIKRLQAEMGLKKANEGAIPKWFKLDPSQLAALRDRLTDSVMNKEGQVIRDPAQIMDMWGRALKSTSNGQWDPSSNAMIDTWRDDLLQELLPVWNKQHPKKQYAWRNGKLTRK